MWNGTWSQCFSGAVSWLLSEQELYVDPTELDCIGKHLFCFSCINEFLENEGCTNKCPVCNTSISKKRRDQILTAGCVMFATFLLLPVDCSWSVQPQRCFDSRTSVKNPISGQVTAT